MKEDRAISLLFPLSDVGVTFLQTNVLKPEIEEFGFAATPAVSSGDRPLSNGACNVLSVKRTEPISAQVLSLLGITGV